MESHWLEDDASPSFQSKVIWHETILHVLHTNQKRFISLEPLKTHLKK